MLRNLFLVAAASIASVVLTANPQTRSLGQQPGVAGSDLTINTSSSMFSVAYLDVAPASARAAADRLKRYRAAAQHEDGLVRAEFLEQVDRPGRFMLLEAWRDQKALDAYTAKSETKQLFEGLKALAIGAYDQRPYRALSTAPAPASFPDGAVYGVMHVDTTPTPDSNAVGLLQTLAAASRKEDGNLCFDVVQHPMRANHFTVIEVWRDKKSADAHALAAHTKTFRQDLLPILGSPYDDRFYRPIE
jgi:quinol monooxygenase YgiN